LRIQGYYAAHAGITLPNAGSVGLHKALGFRPVGVYRSVGYKLGAWHERRLVAAHAAGPRGRAAAALSLADAQRRGEWEAGLAAGEMLPSR